MIRILLALGLLGLLAACGGAPGDDSTTTTSSPMLECFYENCEPPPPPPPPYECETAFAYGAECPDPEYSVATYPPPEECVEPDSECFLELGFSRWGWSIDLPNPLVGTITLDLWAGAAQCETWRGTLVGSVDVYCDGNDLVVEYNAAPGVDLDETHLYVGNHAVPLIKAGSKWKETVAPGQYPFADPDGEYVIEDGCDPLPNYLIAHAVACWGEPVE